MVENRTDPLAPARSPVPPVKCCSPCVEMSMNVVRSVVPESCHPHVSVPQFVSTQPTKVSLPLPTISPETALTARSSVKVPVPEMSPFHVSVSPAQWTRNICPVCTNAPQVPSDPGGDRARHRDSGCTRESRYDKCQDHNSGRYAETWPASFLEADRSTSCQLRLKPPKSLQVSEIPMRLSRRE